MAVTSIQSLKKYAEGSEVELSGFVNRETITVRLKRPSLFGLAESGKIPNPLLRVAAGLFKNGVTQTAGEGESFKDTASLVVQVAKAALVEPTYDDFAEAGLTLTDTQLLEIYHFTQTGVELMSRFRGKQGSDKSAGAGKKAKA